MEGANIAASSPSSSSLGKYRLIAELGHGGMAEVYLAVVRGPAGFNKLVVIKQIRPQLAEDPEFLNMFLDEARLAARLSHPNVVQTNEVGQDGERYFIAMEYLEGQPLNRIIHRLARTGQTLPLEMHVRILIEVLGGLHHAHELNDYDGQHLGVVHRDVTPHNVFVTYDGQVKVVDFGIAKALNSSAETRTGVLKGKVAYMAPEQARGDRVDRRADVFSVGVLLWEAAAGKRLWKGVPDITILQRLLAGDIPSPRTVNPEIPEALEPIIMKALANDRDARYASAAELQTELEAFAEAQGYRVTTRDIGKLTQKTFEADRLKIKTLIEDQLKVKPTDSRTSLPLIDPLTSGSSLPQVNDRLSAEPPSRTQMSEGGGATPVGATPNAMSSSTSLSSAGSFTGATPTSPPRRGLVAGGALALGAVLAVGFYLATRTAAPAGEVPGVKPSNDATTKAAETQATAPPTAPATATSVEIKITAAPQDAHIFLDDKALSGNPYTGKLPKDGATHTIRVEASGFATVNRTITFDKDLDLELALPKEEKAKRNWTPPPTDDDPMKHPGTKPKRNVDPNNPYNK